MDASFPLRDNPNRVPALPDRFLEWLGRPLLRVRGPKTQDSDTFARSHLRHGAPNSVSDEGMHRSFCARQRSQEARSGSVGVEAAFFIMNDVPCVTRCDNARVEYAND